MKPPSPPLTYFPAYLGLFASLVLAVICNTFLDIQYGGFAFESIFWVVVFGMTVRIAWRQGGTVSAAGKSAQKTVFILGVILSLLVFLPMWGFPRAGLAMLAMLQATQNCVAVTRKDLHMGLLVSAVMVMFAASHYRADWTMLFYLVPYVIAVVFTLVAEQISRRASELRKDSLNAGSTRGQGVAIVAATLVILVSGGTLYALTPQVTWPYLFWKFGQPGRLGLLGDSAGTGNTGQRPGERGGGGSGTAADGNGGAAGGSVMGGSSANNGANNGQPEAGDDPSQLPQGGLPSPAEMRTAAARKGMPQWQSAAIMQLADLTEMTQLTLQPIRLNIDAMLDDLKDWLRQNLAEIRQMLMALILLALLVAAWLLAREARVGAWLRCRFDFLRLGLLRGHAPGNAGALQYYAALQRLMDLQGLPRPLQQNTREYLARIGYRYDHVKREAVELTLHFERARYGNRDTSAAELARMRTLYFAVYKSVNAVD